MLARYFDLPFRKDVLRRILQEQLSRAEDKGLGLLQFAAVCDLMGLRASILDVSQHQFSRLEFPALILQDGHPQVLWEIGPSDYLVGDPRTNQERRALDLLVDFNDDSTIQVLTIQRTATSPTKRFGLKWFIPALKQQHYFDPSAAQLFCSVVWFVIVLIQQIIDAVITQETFLALMSLVHC